MATEKKPAAAEELSLSQAILAPLDAVFKAQIHAARSFINMLWQMAYPHLPVDENGNTEHNFDKENVRKPYSFPLRFQLGNPGEMKTVTMEIPTIAMIPITPLGVEEASIKFSMSVTGMENNTQLQASEAQNFSDRSADQFNEHNRPWFLVQNPKSLKGSIVANSSNASSIDIEIKLAKSPIPAALEKSLSILTQSLAITETLPTGEVKDIKQS